MNLKFNILILFFLGLFATIFGNSPLNVVQNYPQHLLYSSNGYDQPLILAPNLNPVVEIPSTTPTAIVKEKEQSTNLLVQIIKLLWSRTRFGRRQTTTEKISDVPVQDPVVIQPLQLYSYLMQPFPITRTLIREIPIVKRIREYIPIRLPIREQIEHPHQAVIQHHDYQPTVTKIIQPAITEVRQSPTVTKIVEPAIRNIVEPPIIKDVKQTSSKVSTETETIEEVLASLPINSVSSSDVSTNIEEKTSIEENDVIESEDIKTPTPPKSSQSKEEEEELDLPLTLSHQPFNEYGLPEGSNKQQAFNEDSIQTFEVNNDIEIPLSGGSGEGQYYNSYVLSDGTKVAEEGKLVKGKAGNDVLVKKGNYEFIDEKGKIIKVDWIADELGFRILDP